MASRPGLFSSWLGGLDQLDFQGATPNTLPSNNGGLKDFLVGFAPGSLDRRSSTQSPQSSYPAGETLGNIGDTWYEIIHVFPLFFNFGNVLTAIQTEVRVYNADRYSSHVFSSFENNAGDGISFTNLPALPYVIASQHGLTLTLLVTSDGPPTINGTLDFVFDLYTFSLALTGNRIVMFPFEPEVPLAERLRFLTDILERKDGTEQRIALRENPRQEFEFEVYREEGDELMRFEILMFDWQARVFGLPVWTERTNLVAPASPADTVVTVKSTANADFRVGGLAIVYSSETSFEALEVAAVGSSTVTFATPLDGGFPVGALVMPIRTAVASSSIRGTRWNRNLAKRELRFRVLDNAVGASFADAAPYTVADAGSVLNGEIFLSGANAADGQMSESFDRRIQVFDNSTGVQSIGSTTDYNRRGLSYRFVPKTRAELWKVRRLLHALRGRQVSFFVPTAFRDLRVTAIWTNGSAGLTIANVGFSQFARQRNRFSVVRMTLTDGTVLDAVITASASLSASEEQLTLSRLAPRDIAPGEFERVDFVERVRLDTDDITITHIDGLGQSAIAFGVRSVIT